MIFLFNQIFTENTNDIRAILELYISLSLKRKQISAYYDQFSKVMRNDFTKKSLVSSYTFTYSFFNVLDIYISWKILRELFHIVLISLILSRSNMFFFCSTTYLTSVMSFWRWQDRLLFECNASAWNRYPYKNIQIRRSLKKVFDALENNCKNYSQAKEVLDSS